MTSLRPISTVLSSGLLLAFLGTGEAMASPVDEVMDDFLSICGRGEADHSRRIDGFSASGWKAVPDGEMQAVAKMLQIARSELGDGVVLKQLTNLRRSFSGTDAYAILTEIEVADSNVLGCNVYVPAAPSQESRESIARILPEKPSEQLDQAGVIFNQRWQNPSSFDGVVRIQAAYLFEGGLPSMMLDYSGLALAMTRVN